MKNLILICFLGFLTNSYAQINVALLHQLVQHSKDENQRQKTARNRQMVSLTMEEENRNQMNSLKGRYRLLQQRFSILSLALDASSVGIKASKIISSILNQQSLIVSLSSKNPVLIPLALNAETAISKETLSLSKYILGLSLSIGDMNQMKQSDRKILLEHILTELSTIEASSRSLAVTIENFLELSGYNYPFSDFINIDKQLVRNILDKLKLLQQ